MKLSYFALLFVLMLTHSAYGYGAGAGDPYSEVQNGPRYLEAAPAPIRARSFYLDEGRLHADRTEEATLKICAFLWKIIQHRRAIWLNTVK